jgi:predicted CDP-diglyceride synthetase/phosphatidate cytidylyltransferase
VHPVLTLSLLLLLAVANATPVFAKKVFGAAFAWPLDGGATWSDGRPVLGPAKTVRGIVLSLVASTIAAALMGLGPTVGIVVAACAMAGDLLSSFVKRRLGIPSSGMAIGLDQIPESLLPLAAAKLLLPITWLDVALSTAIFFVGELLLSRLLFKLRVRDTPY